VTTQYTFYEVLSDMGHRPYVYSLSTLEELGAFVDGYRFALRQHSLPTESPPFQQFAEWLVRRLGRGSTSSGWLALAKHDGQDDAAAIQQFGALIDEFARRIPRVIAEVQIDPARHKPTGRFRLEHESETGEPGWVVEMLPKRVCIRQYATDPGCYLEYDFASTTYEQYLPGYKEACDEASADISGLEGDWVWF
jgi:hypothetical protein